MGAAVAAAGDNSAIAGAISAGGAEAAAPMISNWLYGEEDGSKLNTEQKETVTAITNLLGTAMGAAVGNSAANAAQGSLNAQSAVENNWDAQYMQENRNYFSGVDSTAKNAFINNKGNVDAMMKAINDFNICNGCKDDGHRYIEFLLGVSGGVSMIVMSGGTTIGIVKGPEALRYLNILRQTAQNPTARNFIINGSANAAISAVANESDRNIGSVLYNFGVGGTAGVVASRMPTPTYGSIAQGTVYGYGQLAKDIVTEKDAKQPSTSEAWGNAGKAFIGGYLGGFVGSKATNATSKYFPKTSGDAKTTIDALFGSSTSTSFGTWVNKITEKQKEKK